MKVLRAAVGAAWFAMLIGGCTTTKETTTDTLQREEMAEQQRRDRTAAMQLFIDGSLKESKGEYAEAILDYQDALRLDKNPAIHHAMAKNYMALKRFVPAVENALEAVRLDSAKVEYRELLAQVYIYSVQFQKAAEVYRGILAIDPNNITALFSLAQILERTRPMESLDLYERIVQRQGPSWEILMQLAQINTMMQRYDKAAAAFEQMLELDPNNITVKQSLADVYTRQKQYDKALEVINDVLELNPGDLFLRASLVDVYLQQNRWNDARKEMDTILRSDSLDPDLQFRIGLAFYSQSVKDTLLIPDAIAVFMQFEKEYPTDWRPHLYLGVLYRLIRQDSVAESYLNKATTSANWSGDAWWQLGWLYFDRQDFKETIASMNKAKANVPNDFRIYMLLGIAYNRAGMNEDSRVALERAHELNPQDINVLSSLGLTYDALKMHTESDSAYEKALRIDSDYALVLNNYAYSLSERNTQLDRALRMSKRSLEKDSLNSSYLDTFGWILFQLGRYREALIYIQKAVDAGDASPVVLEHLGDVHAKLGNIDEAKKYWTMALEKDKKNGQLQKKIERGRL
jgi:tetratricopeptide (TPR) repeat protein